MELDTLAYCCGVAVLGEFPEDGWDWEYSGENTLKEKITEINRALSSAHYGTERRPILTTLNVEQKKEWGTALNRCGFRQIKSFVNPNTGNTIFMYYRPEVAKAKKRKS